MITVKKQKLKGIIIKQEIYKEDSIKVTILTNNGICSLVCRGGHKINSKLRPLCQVLTEVELVTTNNLVLNNITEGVVLNNYTLIKEDTNKLLVGLSMIELFYSFIDSINEFNSTYNFLINCLNLLSNTIYHRSLLSLFEIKFLYAIGTYPSFNECISCRRRLGKYFSVKHGGNVCEKCSDFTSCNAELSKLIEMIFYIKITKISEEFLKIVNDFILEIDKVISEYYETYFDYHNKNKKMLTKIS